MDQQQPPSVRHDSHSGDSRHGDPWLSFGHLVSGVLLYGLIGWALDRWLDTSFLVVIGILFGAGLGIYLTWARFREIAPADAPPPELPEDETT